MRSILIAALMVAALPASAFASTCEQSFAKKGNPVTGLRFTASVTVPDLSPASAIGQMQGIAAAKGYDVLTAEPEEGSMLMEQPMSGKARAFPIMVAATRSGTNGIVALEAKLPVGMAAGADGARTEMCALLAQLKGGKAGLAAAARGKGAVSTAAPVALNTLALSKQVAKDIERNAAAVPLRYKDKAFTLSGMVDHVARDGTAYRVDFRIPHPHEEVVRLPNAAPFKVDISCLTAKGQNAYALTLKPGKQVKLTGTVEAIDTDRRIMWLRDCRPAS